MILLFVLIQNNRTSTATLNGSVNNNNHKPEITSSQVSSVKPGIITQLPSSKRKASVSGIYLRRELMKNRMRFNLESDKGMFDGKRRNSNAIHPDGAIVETHFKVFLCLI